MEDQINLDKVKEAPPQIMKNIEREFKKLSKMKNAVVKDVIMTVEKKRVEDSLVWVWKLVQETTVLAKIRYIDPRPLERIKEESEKVKADIEERRVEAVTDLDETINLVK